MGSGQLGRGAPMRADSFGLEEEKPHKHKLSEVRVDFLDWRWTPLAAPPAPPLARSARQGGGSAPIQEIRADIGQFMFMWISFLLW